MKTAYPLQWLFGLISTSMPLFVVKDEKSVALTSFHGDGYRGNTKVLFESLCSHPVLKPVWLSRDPVLISDLKDKFGSGRAALLHSADGLKALGSASALMITHGTSDFPFMRLPRRATLIQTYHGLPTKRGEYMRPKNDKDPNFFHRLILKYRFNPIDYFLSSSPMVSNIFSRRFGLSEEQFVETGYPLYDQLLNSSPDLSLLNHIWPDPPAAKKMILYSPTYRKLSKTRWFPFPDRDLDRFARFLEDEGILLFMRPHPNEEIDFSIYQKISPRFILADQDHLEDVWPLLLLMDAVITDYSSIFIEGLLKDIPPIFIPYDIDSYERGLPYSYDEVTPGDKVSTQKQFVDAIQAAIHNPEQYANKRRKVKKLFFSDTDGNATGKTIQFLESLLLMQEIDEHQTEKPTFL